MPIIKQQTTQPYQLLNKGVEATHLLDLPIGETIEYSTDVLDRVEHASIEDAAQDIDARNLTPTDAMMQGIPQFNVDGTPNADWAILRQQLGMEIGFVDWTDEDVGAVFGMNYSTSGMTGNAGTQQKNGVQRIISEDTGGLVASGFDQFMVLRPDADVQSQTEVATDRVQIFGLTQGTLEITYGSGGTLEADDTLEVYFDTFDQDGIVTSQLVAQHSGDVPRQDLKMSVDMTGKHHAAVRIVSRLGDGPAECHCILSAMLQ